MQLQLKPMVWAQYLTLTQHVRAHVRLLQSACRSLLHGSWDYEAFRRTHLKKYLHSCTLTAECQPCCSLTDSSH